MPVLIALTIACHKAAPVPVILSKTSGVLPGRPTVIRVLPACDPAEIVMLIPLP
jgi:hypothetical protein